MVFFHCQSAVCSGAGDDSVYHTEWFKAKGNVEEDEILTKNATKITSLGENCTAIPFDTADQMGPEGGLSEASEGPEKVLHTSEYRTVSLWAATGDTIHPSDCVIQLYWSGKRWDRCGAKQLESLKSDPEIRKLSWWCVTAKGQDPCRYGWEYWWQRWLPARGCGAEVSASENARSAEVVCKLGRKRERQPHLG